MAESRADEFYVGYLPRAPDGVARRVRVAVGVLFALAAAVALTVVATQGGFAAAFYEYLVFRDFEGVVREDPYPVLVVERPGETAAGSERSRFYLVAPDKRSADVAGLDGRRARLRGSLIYRDDQTMIAVEPGAIEPLADDGAAAGARGHGRHTLRGRIVDSKCYLGVMKPGSTQPHRACAELCIRGGMPPLFVVSEARGPAAYLLLVGADGRAVNREVLALVDEPLEITGELERVDDLWLLKAEPAGYRRLTR